MNDLTKDRIIIVLLTAPALFSYLVLLLFGMDDKVDPGIVWNSFKRAWREGL